MLLVPFSCSDFIGRGVVSRRADVHLFRNMVCRVGGARHKYQYTLLLPGVAHLKLPRDEMDCWRAEGTQACYADTFATMPTKNWKHSTLRRKKTRLILVITENIAFCFVALLTRSFYPTGLTTAVFGITLTRALRQEQQVKMQL